MLSEEMSNATAALMAKFSAKAQAKKRALQDQMRVVSLESLDLIHAEMERLRVEGGRDLGDAGTAVLLVRQQLETADFNNAIAIAVIEQVKTASKWSDASDHFSPDVVEMRKRLQEQMRSLIVEDFDVSLEELRRLALESSGREAMDYQEASALLGLMQQQLENQDLEEPMAGSLGLLVNVARSAAKEDMQKQSQGN